MSKIFAVIMISLSFSIPSLAAIGNKNAPVGGTVFLDLGGEPSTLNPFTATDAYAQLVLGRTFDSLVIRNIDTYEVEPHLAEKYEVSKDGLTYTFYIRKGATFHDGKPITAEDVKFSYEAIMNPEYKAVVLRPFYAFIESVKIHNSHKISFKVKKKYFKNIDFIGGLTILPKHKYGNPKKKFNKKVYASGAYIIEKWDKGRKIVLKRNKKWWGFKLDKYKGVNNFNKIIYRFVKEQNVKIEMIKKGKIDFLKMRPDMYAKLAVGKEWGKQVFKVAAKSKSAKSYSYVGWNLKDEKFKDKRVRHAMSLLLNRKFIIDKFLHGLYQEARGPWYPSSMYADDSVKPDPFDPKKALDLLRAAGWSDSDKNGVLDKVINGKKTPMSFTIITAAQETVKVLTTYKEEAKKVGVDVNIKLVEWQTLLKLKNSGKFEGCAMAWGGLVHGDPHQIWHTDSTVKGGSNYVQYSDPQVDKWITQARGIISNEKRVPVMKKIYKKIAEDRPYLFMFTPKEDLYAYTKRMKKEKETYTYGIGLSYWWLEKQ